MPITKSKRILLRAATTLAPRRFLSRVVLVIKKYSDDIIISFHGGIALREREREKLIERERERLRERKGGEVCSSRKTSGVKKK